MNENINEQIRNQVWDYISEKNYYNVMKHVDIEISSQIKNQIIHKIMEKFRKYPTNKFNNYTVEQILEEIKNKVN
jgi:formylmethanofuran dehydrogenase subunit A